VQTTKQKQQHINNPGIASNGNKCVHFKVCMLSETLIWDRWWWSLSSMSHDECCMLNIHEFDVRDVVSEELSHKPRHKGEQIVIYNCIFRPIYSTIPLWFSLSIFGICSNNVIVNQEGSLYNDCLILYLIDSVIKWI